MQGLLWRAAGLSAAAALAAAPSSASPRFFAAICDYADTGDVAGYAVALDDAGRRPRITLSWSEGAMMAPVAASSAAFDHVSGRLDFTVPARGSAYRFAGRVRGAVLVGELTGPDGPQRLRLERRPSRLAYRPAGPCPPPVPTPHPGA